MAYKGGLFEASQENCISKENATIRQLLYFLCIEDVTKQIENTFYTTKIRTLSTVFFVLQNALF